MATPIKRLGYKLATNPEISKGTIAQGFITPKQDKNPQIQNIPPKRVLPIIFIPGIMGSNLRVNQARQEKLKQTHNISWRPDNSKITIQQYNDSAAERQLRLDPFATEVDSYEPDSNPTGDVHESSDRRNNKVLYSGGYRGWGNLDGPLLQADPPGVKNRRSQHQKARERGWGEVYYGSYEKILSICESKLNSAFTGGSIDLFLRRNIVGINPSKWQAHPDSKLTELDEKTMRDAVKGCWFPVHAMGYNWLRSNGESGSVIAKRITNLIKKYQDDGFQCEKVILVTHSMGGLVARAVIHPKLGNIKNKILGVIHGVMPANGAGAAYKRMRCGVEGSYQGVSSEITAGVLGDNAEDVTAVLANAQGALELLPNKEYGKNWLQLKKGNRIIKSWPKNCPYEEIYKIKGKWFGLLRESWINPAGAKLSGINRTIKLLDDAKKFHETIKDSYHEQSYAHYGSDINRKAWHKVVWETDYGCEIEDVESLKVYSDDRKGELELVPMLLPRGGSPSTPINVEMLGPVDPGDQTVPVHSADAQHRSGVFKGIFRQIGYEHQASYSDPIVISSTIYILFKIISTMKWSNYD